MCLTKLWRKKMDNTALQKTWDEAFVGEAAEQIDTYVSMPQQEQASAEKPHFVVDDISKADWCVRKINKIRTKEADIDKIADEQIARINIWRSSEKEAAGRERLFFESVLLPFAQQYLAELNNGKKTLKKSFKTPNGTIGFKTGSINFAYDGEKAEATNAKLTEYLKTSAPDYIEIKQLAKWGELKKNLTIDDKGTVILKDTGEIIEKMKTAKLPDTFYVKE